MRRCAIFVGLVAVLFGFLAYNPFKSPHPASGMSGFQDSVFALMKKGDEVYHKLKEDNHRFTGQIHAVEGYLANKVVILTGGTSGLGKGIAAHLLSLGAELVLPCRKVPENFKEDLVELANNIRKTYSKTKHRGSIDQKEAMKNITMIKMDLSDVTSIKMAVSQIKRIYPAVSYLINNAGLVNGNGLLSNQGIELSLAVNAIGPAIFTELLLSENILSPGAIGPIKGTYSTPVIISVSSEEFRKSPLIDFSKDLVEQDVLKDLSLITWQDRYAFSKLIQATYFTSLQERFPIGGLTEGKTIFFIDICPGAVQSSVALNAVRGNPWLEPLGKIIDKIIKSSFSGFLPVEEAALPIIRLITDPETRIFAGEHLLRGAISVMRDDMRGDKTRKWVQNQMKELYFRYT